jgi:hypothetical protein
MRIIHYLLLSALCFMFATTLRAQSDDLSDDDYKVAARYGYAASSVRASFLEKRRTVNRDEIHRTVAWAMENDEVEFASHYDRAVGNLLAKADVILRAEGHAALADEIEAEYQAHYKAAAMSRVLGLKEIGDHPPFSKWLADVHDKIHNAITGFLCKQLHFHDIMILNHGLPVVFAPSKYTQPEYLDHFAGHVIWGWLFEHHGVAGVITYWVVDGVCIAGTYGMGLVTFVCGPLATFSENIMDKNIAPPIAKRIWTRANPQ